jgi:peptide/nickel transport system permease protein
MSVGESVAGQQNEAKLDMVVRAKRHPGRRAFQSWRGRIGVLITGIFVLMAVTAPLIVPHDPYKQALAHRQQPPFWESDGSTSYPLGTDSLGRDVLSRIILGSRASLLVGFTSVLLGSVVGVSLGLLSGYFGGITDSIVTRLGDVQLAFPALLLAIVVMAILGQGLRNVVLVLAVTGWVQYARIVRARTFSLREAEFVQAARAIGVPNLRIMFRHILPNVSNVIIVIASFAIPQVILAEAALSFLGVGIAPPTPTWGNMVADGRDYISSAWWLSLWPGVALMICLLGINMVGNWLRDLLDPRMKNL